MHPIKFRFIWQCGFRGEFFSKIKLSEKKCLWAAMFDDDRIEMCNFYRGPIKDASYQVSVHLV
jgi:hypothetical protein